MLKVFFNVEEVKNQDFDFTIYVAKKDRFSDLEKFSPPVSNSDEKQCIFLSPGSRTLFLVPTVKDAMDYFRKQSGKINKKKSNYDATMSVLCFQSIETEENLLNIVKMIQYLEPQPLDLCFFNNNKKKVLNFLFEKVVNKIDFQGKVTYFNWRVGGKKFVRKSNIWKPFIEEEMSVLDLFETEKIKKQINSFIKSFEERSESRENVDLASIMSVVLEGNENVTALFYTNKMLEKYGVSRVSIEFYVRETKTKITLSQFLENKLEESVIIMKKEAAKTIINNLNFRKEYDKTTDIFHPENKDLLVKYWNDLESNCPSEQRSVSDNNPRIFDFIKLFNKNNETYKNLDAEQNLESRLSEYKKIAKRMQEVRDAFYDEKDALVDIFIKDTSSANKRKIEDVMEKENESISKIRTQIAALLGHWFLINTDESDKTPNYSFLQLESDLNKIQKYYGLSYSEQKILEAPEIVFVKEEKEEDNTELEALLEIQSEIVRAQDMSLSDVKQISEKIFSTDELERHDIIKSAPAELANPLLTEQEYFIRKKIENDDDVKETERELLRKKMDLIRETEKQMKANKACVVPKPRPAAKAAEKQIDCYFPNTKESLLSFMDEEDKRFTPDPEDRKYCKYTFQELEGAEKEDYFSMTSEGFERKPKEEKKINPKELPTEPQNLDVELKKVEKYESSLNQGRVLIPTAGTRETPKVLEEASVVSLIFEQEIADCLFAEENYDNRFDALESGSLEKYRSGEGYQQFIDDLEVYLDYNIKKELNKVCEENVIILSDKKVIRDYLRDFSKICSLYAKNSTDPAVQEEIQELDKRMIEAMSSPFTVLDQYFLKILEAFDKNNDLGVRYLDSYVGLWYSFYTERMVTFLKDNPGLNKEKSLEFIQKITGKMFSSAVIQTLEKYNDHPNVFAKENGTESMDLKRLYQNYSERVWEKINHDFSRATLFVSENKMWSNLLMNMVTGGSLKAWEGANSRTEEDNDKENSENVVSEADIEDKEDSIKMEESVFSFREDSDPEKSEKEDFVAEKIIAESEKIEETQKNQKIADCVVPKEPAAEPEINEEDCSEVEYYEYKVLSLTTAIEELMEKVENPKNNDKKRTAADKKQLKEFKKDLKNLTDNKIIGIDKFEACLTLSGVDYVFVKEVSVLSGFSENIVKKSIVDKIEIEFHNFLGKKGIVKKELLAGVIIKGASATKSAKFSYSRKQNVFSSVSKDRISEAIKKPIPEAKIKNISNLSFVGSVEKTLLESSLPKIIGDLDLYEKNIVDDVFYEKKPISLIKSLIISSLLPTSNDNILDENVFSKVLNLDDDSLWKNREKQIPHEKVSHYVLANPSALVLNTAEKQREVFNKMKMIEKFEYCPPQLEKEETSSENLDFLNSYYKTTAKNKQELLAQLSDLVYGKQIEIGDYSLEKDEVEDLNYEGRKTRKNNSEKHDMFFADFTSATLNENNKNYDLDTVFTKINTKMPNGGLAILILDQEGQLNPNKLAANLFEKDIELLKIHTCQNTADNLKEPKVVFILKKMV